MDIIEDTRDRVSIRLSIAGGWLAGLVVLIASFIIGASAWQAGPAFFDEWFPMLVWSVIWLIGFYALTSDKVISVDRSRKTVFIIKRAFGLRMRPNEIPFDQVLGVHLDFIQRQTTMRVLRGPMGEWFMAFATVGGRVPLGRDAEHIYIRSVADKIAGLVGAPVVQTGEQVPPVGGFPYPR